MSRPDATAAAALSAEVVKPVFFAWLDFVGDPVRTNTSGTDVTPSGTGDADLDGHNFIGISGALVDVSPVRFAAGGSDSVTARLSGIPGLDDDTLAMMADRANWQGRNARLWRIIRNASNVRQGGYHAYYTGKITAMGHSSQGDEQILTVTIESYLAAFSRASNRTYLSQERYDSGDLSAKAAIAIANGNYSGAVSGSTYSGAQGDLLARAAWMRR